VHRGEALIMLDPFLVIDKVIFYAIDLLIDGFIFVKNSLFFINKFNIFHIVDYNYSIIIVPSLVQQ